MSYGKNTASKKCNMIILKEELGMESIYKLSDKYGTLGYKYHQTAEYKEAILCYRKGIKLNPKNDKIFCKLGLTYHNLGKHREAIKSYEKSINIDDKNEEAQYYLGFIMVQEDELEKAVMYLKKALSINENMGIAYYYLCTTLTKLNRTKEAKKIIEERVMNQCPNLQSNEVFTLGEIISGRREYKTHKDHNKELVDTLLIRMEKKQIHCFGDSHRSIMNNIENVKCYNVGSATAYNLCQTDSTTGAGNKILSELKDLKKENDIILLVFGEIDCMEHINKNEYKMGGGSLKIINDLVKRYMEFAKKIRNEGFNVIVMGPSFSGYALNSYGSVETRNRQVELFNNKLADLISGEENIYFVSINEIMVNHHHQPNWKLTEDGRHVDNFPIGSKTIQNIIISKIIKEVKKKRAKVDNKAEIIECIETTKGKPYAHITCTERRKERGNRKVSSGIINEETKIHIIQGQDNWIILDMLDHQRLENGTICLGEESDQTIKAKIEVRLFSLNKIEKLKETSYQVKPNEEIKIIKEPCITRAVAIRIRLDTMKGNCYIKRVCIKSREILV